MPKGKMANAARAHRQAAREAGTLQPVSFVGALTRKLSGDPSDINAIVEKLIEAAKSGDMAAIREVGDRLDGKPAQAITGANGGPVAMTIEVACQGITLSARSQAIALGQYSGDSTTAPHGGPSS